MRTSESVDKINAAMARVQARLTTVTRNKTVEVEGKDGKRGWESKYVTLDKLYEAAKPALMSENIVIYQGGEFVAGGGERLFTRLALVDQWVECSFPVKVSRDGAQGYGGGMSFARRWGVCCMIGLVAAGDEDERAGYQDNRPAPRTRAKAVPGLAERIAGISAAATTDELARRAVEARSTHALPDESTAVERAISAWFAQAFGDVRSLDELATMRDACIKVKPRGNEVREAFRVAETRLANGHA